MFIIQSGDFIHNSYEIDIKCFITDIDIEKSDKHLIIHKFTLQFLYKKHLKEIMDRYTQTRS